MGEEDRDEAEAVGIKQRGTYGERFSFVINHFLSILKLLDEFELTKRGGKRGQRKRDDFSQFRKSNFR